MQTILEEFLEKVNQGEKFSISFEKRNMKIGKKYLIKNGKIPEDRVIASFTFPILEHIEELYQKYKYSCPSEKSENKRRNYFKANPIDELEDEDLILGLNREYARAQLEGYILCCIVEGHLVWNDSWGNFFWQSQNDKDLIILKQWIEEKN